MNQDLRIVITPRTIECGGRTTHYDTVEISVPGGGSVHRVRFLSPCADPRPVAAYYPWPHPWWETGGYETEDGGDGAVIAAYVSPDKIEDIKGAWPGVTEYIFNEGPFDHYVYSSRFQPSLLWLAEHIDENFAQELHEDPQSRWERIVEVLREFTCQPTPDDFVYWWLNEQGCRTVRDMLEERSLQNWPYYLRNEISSMYGRALRGRLWVTARWIGIAPNIDDDCCDRIDTSCGGIAILRKDIDKVASLPGYVTDKRHNIIRQTEVENRTTV